MKISQVVVLVCVLLFAMPIFAEVDNDIKSDISTKQIVANIGMCIGDCASEQGICIGYCQGDGQCISNCAAAHGRCVARCHSRQ